MRSKRLEVSNLEMIPPDRIPGLLRQALESGGYVVGIKGQPVDRSVRALYPPDQLSSWRASETAYIPSYVIHRLKH
jgi:hypothetical protein